MSDDPQLPERDDAALYGKLMVIGFWIILVVLLSFAAHRWMENSHNPNRNLNSTVRDGQLSVQLHGNRLGHYVANGTINGEPVTFLLDTGASFISVPQPVADRLGLERGHPRTMSTANGSITVYSTELNSVAIADLQRNRVTGHINPYMDGEEILLGMSFLRHFELIQRDNILTIKTP